jgi:hypothetical protein
MKGDDLEKGRIDQMFGLKSRKQEIYYFSPGDRVTWNEKTGVNPGSSHLCYEKELGKDLVIVEASREIPQEVRDKYDGSGLYSPHSHQYVKVNRGKGSSNWFDATWFKPC